MTWSGNFKFVGWDLGGVDVEVEFKESLGVDFLLFGCYGYSRIFFKVIM